MITAAELIEQLKEVPADYIVVVADTTTDRGAAPVIQTAIAVYSPDSRTSGQVGVAELTEGLMEQGFGEEDVMPDGLPCVVLSVARDG